MDKYTVKECVSDLIQAEFVIPTLGVWEKAEDIDPGSLPQIFINIPRFDISVSLINWSLFGGQLYSTKGVIMSDYLVKKICEYVKEEEIDVLYRRFEDSQEIYKSNGFIKYRFNYISHFYKNSDWGRFIKHLISDKSVKREFYRETKPAFYKDGSMTPPSFYEAICDIKEFSDEIVSLCYYDEKSYRVLCTILLFRLTGDRNFLFLEVDKPNDMYFDNTIIPEFRPDWYEGLIDCGAYTGDTIKSFLYHVHSRLINNIWAFEPNKDNYRILANNTKNMNFVRLFDAAVGKETNEVVGFTGSDLGGRLISTEGEIVNGVDVKSIDDVAKDKKVTFIKMDIEGAEFQALEGATKTIKRCKPVMAISVYHKIEDFYKLQLYINRLQMDYRFALRHYGVSMSEYVLYCF